LPWVGYDSKARLCLPSGMRCWPLKRQCLIEEPPSFIAICTRALRGGWSVRDGFGVAEEQFVNPHPVHSDPEPLGMPRRMGSGSPSLSSPSPPRLLPDSLFLQ
jgi:hypothetical protein